ncbi:hypothetical protein L596_030584 [Steinernema carpocapsae]|nr:hypothetical protein L596_030584 [Steinernema carpocapsae]
MTEYVADQQDDQLISTDRQNGNFENADPHLNGYGNLEISEHCHSELLNDQADIKSERVLIAVAVLSAIFIVAEFAGGFIAHSLAIMTDAGHMLSDLLSFIISIIAIRAARSPANQRHSFGYQRAEILGAMLSIIIIWVLTAILVLLAIQRIVDDNYEIHTPSMIITAVAGVVFNIIMFAVLRFGHAHGHSHGHGHSHSHGGPQNVNVRAAIVHVIGDFVQSVGVLAAAIIIKYTDYKVADPICTFLFSIIVVCTSFWVIRDIYLVLMEATPKHMDYSAIQNDLMQLSNVQTVHSLHVWSLNMEKTALSVHLAVVNRNNAIATMKEANQMLKSRHAIKMSTVQVEPFEDIMNTCKHCRPL